MELTTLSHVLIWLRSFVLFLQLWQVVLGHPALALSFVKQFVGVFPFFGFVDLMKRELGVFPKSLFIYKFRS